MSDKYQKALEKIEMLTRGSFRADIDEFIQPIKKVAEKALSQAPAQVEEGKDAKRLDWIEKNGIRLLVAKIPTSEGPTAHVLSAEGWGHALWQVDFDQKCCHGDTLREAIDEAISRAADKAQADKAQGAEK